MEKGYVPSSTQRVMASTSPEDMATKYTKDGHSVSPTEDTQPNNNKPMPKIQQK